jgi:phosphohistidine phosphatase
MRSLWLLRHAKASRDAAYADDHARPLTPRGERAALQVADHLASGDLRPTLILCSTAARTRSTLEPLLDRLEPPPRVEIDPDLYLASAGQLLARLARVSPAEKRVLLVGHNPGLHELAVRLATRGEGAALARLRTKLPTAALVRLELDVAQWRGVAPGCAALAELRFPRDPG